MRKKTAVRYILATVLTLNCVVYSESSQDIPKKKTAESSVTDAEILVSLNKIQDQSTRLEIATYVNYVPGAIIAVAICLHSAIILLACLRKYVLRPKVTVQHG